MNYINCGCGEKYILSEEWINLDFNGKKNEVIGCNLLKGLPFDNNFADAIFSSCMLEHFTKSQGVNFIKECHRVLKPNGIIRIVVPDLENWVNEYINVLEKVKNDEEMYGKRYEYLLIELIDQMTRMSSGGYMYEYWLNDDRDDEYVLERTGYPAGWIENCEQIKNRIVEEKGIKSRIKSLVNSFPLYRYVKLGKFAVSGEQHKWMYDRYSLSKLLRQCGFSDIVKCEYNKSGIPKWKEYGLEVTSTGQEYKPNNLYIEAVK